MKSKLHGMAGALALMCIVGFWSSTLVSELFLAEASVVAVKNAILRVMWLLIPALALTGASGFALGRSRKGRLVTIKMRRMQFIAANGVVVLLPSAWFLASMANAGDFGVAFYALQGVELTAGAVNIALLALNLRDGLRLAGRKAPIPRVNR
ncbi:MAG: hypothetical protein KDF25_13360 [Burkholderiaceae bacterium]|nr:hypothetical protein [Burkholderiaceae bacterium]